MASSFFWRRATWNTGGPIVAVSASATAAAFWPQSNRLEPSLCDTSHTSSTGSSNAHTKFFPADKASLSHGSQIISLKHTDAPLSFSIAGTGTGGPLETKDDTAQLKEGMQPDLEGDFAGLFPLRQLWVPRLSYPLWDTNWDGRQQEATGDREKDHQMQRQIRKHGVTRHIILVRHGQYDETFKVSLVMFIETLSTDLKICPQGYFS